MKKVIYLIPLLLSGGITFAQQKPAEVLPQAKSGDIHMEILIAAVIATAVIILAAASAVLRTVKIISTELAKPEPVMRPSPAPMLEFEEWAALQKAKPGMLTRILGLRPISEEKDILIEHQFDGIAELDNPTPAWFMWLFYGTIAFGIVYILTYHVFDYGKMQEEEYAIEMKTAKAQQTAYLAKSANNIDENSVQESKEGSVISSGQAIYNSNCVACHGDKGQGVVGPNLTDAYWLHGGKINDIFKSIKYGIPEKGMISWEKTLSPKQISDVGNYILSLQGSNPPNAKAAQGVKGEG